MVCIIDDREDVWKMAPNLVHVRPYRFFEGTADINAPPEANKAMAPSDELITEQAPPVSRQRMARIVKVLKKKDISTESNKLTEGSPESKTADDLTETSKEISKESLVKSETTTETNDETKAKAAEHGSDNVRIVLIVKVNEPVEQERSEASEAVQGNAPTQVDAINSDGREVVLHPDKCTDLDKSISSPDPDKCTSSLDPDTSLPDSNKQPKMVDTDETSLEDGNAENSLLSNLPPASEGDANSGKNVTDGEEYEEMIEWEDLDDYLLHLEDILQRIHTAFYEVYDQMNNSTPADDVKVPDLKTIVPYVRKKVLKGMNIMFSGVFPLNQIPESCPAYRVAEALGASVHLNFVAPTSSKDLAGTTHLVAAKLGTQKVKVAAKCKGVHIINPDWLWSCADRWEHVNECLFPLTEESSERFLSRDSPSGVRPNNPVEQFSSPLLTMSKEEISGMDAEVEKFLEESDSSDDADDENAKDLRKKVLTSYSKNKRDRTEVESSSDEDSLSAEFPKGWKTTKRQKLCGTDDTEGDDEGSNKSDDDSSSSASGTKNSNEDFADSIGSVDEEMAAAVEKEFLNYQ